MPWIAAVLAVAAGLAAASSQIAQGKRQSKLLEYNALVDEQNAKAARQSADYSEMLSRRKSEKLIATQRALYGKGGVTPEGSPLLAESETAGDAELDAQAIRFGGTVEEYRNLSSAAVNRWQAKQVRAASRAAAFTSLLKAGSSAAGSFGGGAGGGGGG